MAFFDNNVAVHGIVASSEGFSLTKNNYNVAKISGSTFLYGDTRKKTLLVGGDVILNAVDYGSTVDGYATIEASNYVKIIATNDVSIQCGKYDGNNHINMIGRVAFNNVSYGTDMPSTENAKEGQIYFRIID